MELVGELKELEILIGQRLFQYEKNNAVKTVPSPLQVKILKYILAHQDKIIYQKDLELAFGISKATISDTLASMEKRNIIKREENTLDRRKKRILLTDNSKVVFQKLEKNIKKLNKELKENISKEDLTVFFNILKQMQNNLKKERKENA